MRTLQKEKNRISKYYGFYPIGNFTVTHWIDESVAYGYIEECQGARFETKQSIDYAMPATAYIPGIIRENEHGIEIALLLPERQQSFKAANNLEGGSNVYIGRDLVFKILAADVEIGQAEGTFAHVGILYRKDPCDYEGIYGVLSQCRNGDDVLTFCPWDKTEI